MHKTIKYNKFLYADVPNNTKHQTSEFMTKQINSSVKSEPAPLHTVKTNGVGL